MLAWHDGYEAAPEVGSVCVSVGAGTERVIRGRSWDSVAGICRSAFRGGSGPGGGLGFN